MAAGGQHDVHDRSFSPLLFQRVGAYQAHPHVQCCENVSLASKNHDNKQAQIWGKCLDQGATPSIAPQVGFYYPS